MSIELLQAIQMVQSEIEQETNLNERQTINYLISPILNALGWNVHDRTRVIHEFPVDSGAVDMAFEQDDKTVVLLEAKRLDVNLGEQELQQLGRYCFDLGVPTAILTNGAEWNVYRPLLTTMPTKNRRLIHVNLRKDRAADIERELTRLRYERIDRLDDADLPLMLSNYWNSHASEDLLEPFTQIAREKFAIRHNKRPAEIPFRPIREAVQSKFFEESHPPPPPDDLSDYQHDPLTNWGAVIIDGQRFPMRYKKDVLVQTAEWLIMRGKIKHESCPVRIGRGASYLINTRNLHSDGKPFTNPRRLSNGLFMHTNFSASDSLKHAQNLLRHFGFSPKILHVSDTK